MHAGSEITVYTTPNCPWCHKLKDFLRGEGIDYREINVREDFEEARKMVALTGERSVPVTVIGGEVVTGYAPDKIKELLTGDKSGK